MRRIAKKLKHKEKKKLKSIRKLAPENNGDVISLCSPVVKVDLKMKKKTPSEALSINEGNSREHSSARSRRVTEVREENSSDENGRACENSSSHPILVEVNGDRAVSSSFLKISGSCFKALPSNLAFGFKSKSTIPFSVKSFSPRKCQIYFGNEKDVDQARDENVPEVLKNNEDISDKPVSDNNEDISDLQASGNNENVGFNSEELPLTESDAAEDISFQNDSSLRSDLSVIDSQFKRSYVLEKLADGKMLLAMEHPNTMFFHGSFTIRMLVGAIEVLGYEIGEDDNRTYDVYSPTGSSLLCLETKYKEKETLWDNVCSKLSALEVPPEFLERLHKKFPRLITLVLLQKITNSLPPFLNKHHSGALFPSRTSNDSLPSHHSLLCVHCEFLPKPELRNYRSFSRREEWDEILQFLLSKSEEECALRVMLCGGKSLGKSTLLRYLVNKLLPRYPQVLCLDFDPGQSEFTVPGCVSAVLIQKPLLGPHYTHLAQPCRSIYVGNVNVAQCSFHYLKCCEDIFKFCHSKSEFSNIPWVFNTMGFVRGIGVEITTSLIKMANPTDVIQIQSVSKKRNYPELLTPEYIVNYQRSLFRRFSSEEKSLQYDLHCFSSAAETQGTSGGTNPWGLEAHKLRDLSVLAYFSQIVSKPAYSLLEASPFSIPFAGLKLCISHERVSFQHYLAAMNGNLVALYNVGNIYTLKPSDPDFPEILENTPVCSCIGFGIVRGIDMTKRLVFILSPIGEAERKTIDCLVLGSVRLPPSLYTCTEQAIGHIPYVVSGQQPILSDQPRQTSSLMKKSGEGSRVF